MSSALKRLYWAVGAVAGLTLSYWLWLNPLHDLHNTRGWPELMFQVGLVALGVAAIYDGHRLMLCTVVGYNISFVISIVTEVRWIGYDGTMASSDWIVFTLGLLAFIVAGIVWDIVRIRRKKGGQ